MLIVTNLEKPWQSYSINEVDFAPILLELFLIPFKSFSIGRFIPHHIEYLRYENNVVISRIK